MTDPDSGSSLQRAAGVDFGAVRVGVAVADDLGMLAHPRPALDGRNLETALRSLAELVESDGITVFVVGLPMTLRGEEGRAARRAREFARKLAQRTGVRVELMDERLSTRQAMGRLREQGLSERQARGRVDSAAAAVLLQAWLDALPRSES